MTIEDLKVEAWQATFERIANDLEASECPHRDTSEGPSIDGSSIDQAAEELDDDDLADEETVQEAFVECYKQAEKFILDARAELWEVIDLGDPPKEVANLLKILFDAAVTVRLLRSNVDGLLDGVLPRTTKAATDADEVAG